MYYILGGEKGKNAFKKCLPHSFQSKKWRYIAEQVLSTTSTYFYNVFLSIVK